MAPKPRPAKKAAVEPEHLPSLSPPHTHLARLRRGPSSPSDASHEEDDEPTGRVQEPRARVRRQTNRRVLDEEEEEEEEDEDEDEDEDEEDEDEQGGEEGPRQSEEEVPRPSEEEGEDEDDVEDSQAPPRRYNTRPSTQNARPGVTAGLAPRRREDIVAEAAQKKAEKEAVKDRRDAVKQKAAEKVAGGIAKLARLQEDRRAADLRKAATSRHPPPGLFASQARSSHAGHEKSERRSSAHAPGTHTPTSSSRPESSTRVKRRGPPGIPAALGPPSPTSPLLMPMNIGSPRDDSEPPEPHHPLIDEELDHALLSVPPRLRRSSLASDDSLSESNGNGNRQDDARDFDYAGQGDDHARYDYGPGESDFYGQGDYDDGDTGEAQYDDRENAYGGYDDHDDVGGGAGPPQSDDAGLEDVADHHSLGAEDTMSVDEEDTGVVHYVNRSSGAKRLSEKERKKLERKKLLGQLADARAAVAQPAPSQGRVTDPASKRPRSLTADSHAAPTNQKKIKITGSAVRPNWRDADQPLGPTPARPVSTKRPDASSARPSQSSSRRTSGPRDWRDLLDADETLETPTRSRSRVTSSRRHLSNRITDGEVEEAQGVSSADLMISQSEAVHAAGQRRTMKSRIAVDRVDSDDELNPQCIQKGKSKRTRTRKDDMPVEQSRSSQNIPEFFADVMYTEFVPTVLDYCGSKINPFNMREEGSDELLNICQSILDNLCPDVEYTLTKSDPIYKVAQQEMYNWRSGFVTRAVWVLEHAIAEKFGPQPAAATVRQWIAKISSTDGAAYWKQPSTSKKPSEGKLGSLYILKTFSWHLYKIKGSCGAYGYPAGGLALTAAAMQHTLAMFATGQLISGKKFGGKKVKANTQDWYDKAVSRFMPPNEEKFDALIVVARKFVNVGFTASKTQAGQAEELDVFDRSSPPIYYSDLE